MDLPEALLRGYQTLREVFSTPWGEDPIREILLASLQDLLDEERPSVVGIPMGLGNHVDHILVRDEAMLAVSGLGLQAFLYEELPYVARYSEADIQGMVNILLPGATPRPCDITAMLQRKLNAVSGYKSQIGAEELHSVRSYAVRAGGQVAVERIWMSPTVGGITSDEHAGKGV
jgi:LmbE family N-acetylglucosaminyl deacetylase